MTKPANPTQGRPEGSTTTKRGRAAGGVRVNVLLSAREAGQLNADARREGSSSKGAYLRDLWHATRGEGPLATGGTRVLKPRTFLR